MAADVAKVGKCLLGNCQVVLAKCMADGECLENLICLQLCNGRPDETACQVTRLWRHFAQPRCIACSVPVAVQSVPDVNHRYEGYCYGGALQESLVRCMECD